MRPVFVLVICLLFAAPASAQFPQAIMAEGLRAGGEAAGDVGLLIVHADHDESAPILDLGLEAAEAVGGLYERRETEHMAVPVGGGSVVLTPFPPEFKETPLAFGAMQISLVAADPDYRVIVEGAGTGILASPAMEMRAVTDPYYAPPNGFDGPSGTTDPDDAPHLRARQVEGEYVESRINDLAFDAALTGSMVIELQGIDLEVLTADGTQAISTRQRTEAVHELQPDGTTAVLFTRVTPTLRLHIESGALALAMPLLEGWAGWLMPQAVIQPDGLVAVQGTRAPNGQGLHGFQAEEALTGADAFQVSPKQGTLEVLSHEATPATTDAVAKMSWLGMLVFGTVLAAGLAAFVKRRHGRGKSVEACIESGEYTRAAKLASKQLAKDPSDERAAVALAVALSKAGRHEEVVAEVEPRLGSAAPDDGVLHYLAGLAHLKRGAPAKARERLREAVARTPSLSEAVAGLLPRRDEDGYV